MPVVTHARALKGAIGARLAETVRSKTKGPETVISNVMRGRVAGAALMLMLAGGGATAIAASAHARGDRDGYVLFQAGNDHSVMSGSIEDWQQGKRLRAGREGLLFARRDGRGFVIRDAATLRSADAILAPQRAVAARQSALGERQGALGAKQARLGAEQARLGMRMATLRGEPDPAVRRQQAELGAQQAAYGRQQSVLGAEQSALGREQRRVSREVEARLDALIATAIRDGRATPVR